MFVSVFGSLHVKLTLPMGVGGFVSEFSKVSMH